MRSYSWCTGAVVLLPVVLAGCAAPGTGSSSLPQAVAYAAPNEPSPSDLALDSLEHELLELGVAPTPERSNPEQSPDLEARVEALGQEVRDLGERVARLQEAVDLSLLYVLGDLHEENRQLRRQLMELQANASNPYGNEFDAGTMPDRSAFESGAPDRGDVEKSELPTAGERAADYGEKGYLPVSEWGRSPVEARTMGPNVSSLRGMICAVPPGMTDDQLAELGRRLRNECAGYDNVNIDVFDDEQAARLYAEQNRNPGGHHVLSIVRHKATGRDLIVLVKADGTRQVSLQ